jgi:ERCC4-type nuclease
MSGNQLTDIQITSDEPKCAMFAAKLIDCGVNPIIQKLPSGDFLIFGKNEKGATLVERKEASDFLHSIEGGKNKLGVSEKGRIWNQLERMKESGCGELLVVIEGNPFNKQLTAYRKNGFSKARIWGAMRAIRKFGVGIQMVKDEDEFIEYLAYISREKGTPKKEFSLRVSAPNTLSLRDKKIYLLEGFPGVGPKTAKEILKTQSISDFINNIDRSKAIGSKSKEEIKKIVY